MGRAVLVDSIQPGSGVVFRDETRKETGKGEERGRERGKERERKGKAQGVEALRLIRQITCNSFVGYNGVNKTNGSYRRRSRMKPLLPEYLQRRF